MGFFERIFDTNKRELARISSVVAQINELEPQVKELTDDRMRERIAQLKTEIEAVAPEKQVALLEQHLPEVFAITRETGVRRLG